MRTRTIALSLITLLSIQHTTYSQSFEYSFSPELVDVQTEFTAVGNGLFGFVSTQIDIDAHYRIPRIPAQYYDIASVTIAAKTDNVSYAFRNADNGQFDLGGSLSASLQDIEFENRLIEENLFFGSERRLLGPDVPTPPPSTFHSASIFFPIEESWVSDSSDKDLFLDIGASGDEDAIGLEVSASVFANNLGGLAFIPASSGAIVRSALEEVTITLEIEHLGGDPGGDLLPDDGTFSRIERVARNEDGPNSEIPITEAVAPGILPAGDFNYDFVVDTDDHLAWSESFGNSGINADGNIDDIVSAADYAIFRAQVGEAIPLTQASGVSAVASEAIPEPPPVVAILAGVLTFFQRKRTAYYF